MPRVVMATNAGVFGLPEDTKESGTRVDFNTDDFGIVLETKGYRLAWSRAMLCPCRPVNDQTEQPDPNCPLCKKSGWLYFAPNLATTDKVKVGELDDVQKRIVDDAGGVIVGLLTGIGTKDETYGEIQKRMTGTMMCTVRPENKLGVHDRIVNLDSIITFSQVLDPVTNLSEPTETRYPIHQINVLRTTSKIFTAPADFDVVEGKIVWNTGSSNLPDEEDPVGVHYLCHPTWLIVEHPHSVRMTPVTQKVKKPPTPAGEYVDLPIQAVVQYEFLPDIA